MVTLGWSVVGCVVQVLNISASEHYQCREGLKWRELVKFVLLIVGNPVLTKKKRILTICSTVCCLGEAQTEDLSEQRLLL